MSISHLHEGAIADKMREGFRISSKLLPIMSGDPYVLGRRRVTAHAAALTVSRNGGIQRQSGQSKVIAQRDPNLGFRRASIQELRAVFGKRTVLEVRVRLREKRMRIGACSRAISQRSTNVVQRKDGTTQRVC